MFGKLSFFRLFRRKRHHVELQPQYPDALSQEVLERIAVQYPEAERDEVARMLFGYQVAPVNFGRMRILEAAKGCAADLHDLVECGNQYGKGWTAFSGRAGT